MNLNSPPSHFPTQQISHDNDHELYHPQPFLPNRAPSLSCHFFFDSTLDHSRFYDHQLYRPNHVPGDQNYGVSTYEVKNNRGLELGQWEKEDKELKSRKNPMKWMSSEMRVMHKMKAAGHDRAALKITSSADQKLQASSSSAETDYLSSNSSSYSNNSPIRVCSDCNTTKTPLWRSGPKGPKSLCNACGIRQRKARRAMAAAAAAKAGDSDQSPAKSKLQHKGKLGKKGHASHLKKRCKTEVGLPSTEQKKLGFEDFLINLSKKLAFHRVFPDEEKDAAILLMALSSGLVNG